MSTDTNSEVRAIWQFEDRSIPVSTTNLIGVDHEAPWVNHAELYGLLRQITQAPCCARVLVTVSEPIFIMFYDFADRIMETYSTSFSEYIQFMDLYITAIDPGEERVNWQKEGF